MSTHALFCVCDASLFFGSARPIQAGEVHHAESLFPPPPSTFQGALRGSLYRQLQAEGTSQAELLAKVGPSHRMAEGWSVDGPWVAAVTGAGSDERLEPWLPLPLCAADQSPPTMRSHDAMPQRRSQKRDWALRRTVSRPDRLLLDVDAPLDLVQGGEAAPKLWLQADDLYTLLSTGRVRAPEYIDPPFAKRESRVGLAMDQGRTAKRGMLYFQGKVRMSGAVGASRSGLAVWLSAPNDELVRKITGRPLTLGRRNRPLVVEAPAPPPVDAWSALREGAHIAALSDRELPDGMEVWLVLASPVALDDEQYGTPARPALRVAGPVHIEVRAAVLSAPLHIGGLALEVKGAPTPRPVRAYLQAGTSWRLRLTGGGPTDRRRALHALHHACTLGDADARTFGFGRTWIALLPKDAT